MKKILLSALIVLMAGLANAAGYYGPMPVTGLTDASSVNIDGGTIDGATIGSLKTLNTLYVDGSRADSYTADGGLSRPYKTVLAALTAYTKPYVWVATSIKGTWATD